MRSSYPTKEKVYVIDSGDYSGFFIFPEYTADNQLYQNADAVVVGSIRGNRSPIAKARKEGDRDGDYALVNLTRVHGFREEYLELPSNVLSDVETYNELFPKVGRALLQGDTEDVPEEDLKDFTEAKDSLIQYFNK